MLNGLELAEKFSEIILAAKVLGYDIRVDHQYVRFNGHKNYIYVAKNISTYFVDWGDTLYSLTTLEELEKTLVELL